MSDGNNNITIGKLTESINNKMDRDGANANTSWIFVVLKQDPTSSNNYTWYRVYSDGWVEQGQNYVALTSNGQTFTMPIAMVDNKYNIQCTGVSGTTQTSTSTGIYVSTYDTRTTTTFSCYSGDDDTFNTCYFAWFVSGMAA